MGCAGGGGGVASRAAQGGGTGEPAGAAHGGGTGATGCWAGGGGGGGGAAGSTFSAVESDGATGTARTLPQTAQNFCCALVRGAPQLGQKPKPTAIEISSGSESRASSGTEPPESRAMTELRSAAILQGIGRDSTPNHGPSTASEHRAFRLPPAPRAGTSRRSAPLVGVSRPPPASASRQSLHLPCRSPIRDARATVRPSPPRGDRNARRLFR
jgi:hypothetical protein